MACFTNSQLRLSLFSSGMFEKIQKFLKMGCGEDNLFSKRCLPCRAFFATASFFIFQYDFLFRFFSRTAGQEERFSRHSFLVTKVVMARLIFSSLLHIHTAAVVTLIPMVAHKVNREMIFSLCIFSFPVYCSKKAYS